jgi:hypothetical protein
MTNSTAHTPGFVSVEQYVRNLPLTAKMVDLCVHHAELESKRPVKAICDMLGATLTGRDRVNPLLKKRQTMKAIAS